jgi:hypothetical protein
MAAVDRLRTELIRFPRTDGGLDLLDLLLERLVRLDAAEARGLEAGDPAVLERLGAQLLLESPAVDEMRRAAWAARAAGRPAAAPAPPLSPHGAAAPSGSAALDTRVFDEAAGWPELVATEWRDPERLRRVAEARAAGRRYLMLPSFVAPPAAAALADEAARLPTTRMDTELVRAERCLAGAEDLATWRAFLAAPSTRRILGAILGVELPEATVMNVWRLQRGDSFSVHPDGRLYRGTVSLGLSTGWTAADGGAIAFGDPTPDGLLVRERWLPHAGDVCLFAPDRTTWHAVEPVLSDRARLSVTAWWTA